MNVTVKGRPLCGTVSVCASKSEAHRLLICSLLSCSRTEILCDSLSEDIKATAECIKAMGADVSFDNGVITVDSSKLKDKLGQPQNALLDCGESGSTLRFIIPVVCALGMNCTLSGRGRLPNRPNKPLLDVLRQKGCCFDREDGLPLSVKGQLRGGVFEIAGNISSQYISGLLFALPILKEDSTIKITQKIESLPYIMITLDALEAFGVVAEFNEAKAEIYIKGGQRYRSPGKIRVNGDWSNGAFWLAAAVFSQNKLVCENLTLPTKQGDSVITELIERLQCCGDVASHVIIDASQFPDLVPIISVLAASRRGKTTVCGAERLKIKESNRIESVVNMINALGGKASETADGIIISGNGKLSGGTVQSCNDHRIVMSAAVASLICVDEVKIVNAEAVNKSYPTFFDELERLGAIVERSNE